MKRFLVVLLTLLGILVYAAPAVAAEQLSVSDTITISGVVLPMRYIYLDKAGNIQKVVGNTSVDITPTVLDAENQITQLTSKITSQYQHLLDENGGHLQAGQTYLSDKYNPYILFARWVTTNPYFSQKII